MCLAYSNLASKSGSKAQAFVFDGDLNLNLALHFKFYFLGVSAGLAVVPFHIQPQQPGRETGFDNESRGGERKE